MRERSECNTLCESRPRAAVPRRGWWRGL